MIRRLALNGDAETGLTTKDFPKQKRAYWLEFLLNINWSFERATDAVGFLSYLQINGEYPLGDCAVELKHLHRAGTTECFDENHFTSQEAWHDWGKEMLASACGCVETHTIVRIIGAVIMSNKPYGEESHKAMVQALVQWLENRNPGEKWVAEGRLPPSREGIKPVKLVLGLDEHPTNFRLWLWVDRSDKEKWAWYLRLEGKLGKLMPTGTIFDD